MSQSILSNSSLECKSTSGSKPTLTKVSFEDAKWTLQGATSGTKLRITNLADPTTASDACSKQYVDAQLSGLNLGISWKQSVRARTAAALPTNTYSSGTLTASANAALPAQDGVTLVANDRFLVMNEAAALKNGMYKITNVGSGSAAWTMDRTSDASTTSGSNDLTRAASYVEEGAVYSGRGYVQTADLSTVGTDAIEFSLFATISEVSASDGLGQSGKNISVNVSRGIGIVGDAVSLNDKGVITAYLDDEACGTGQIADGAITSAKMSAASIANSNRFTAGVVGTTALAAAAVTGAKVANKTLGAAHLINSSLTTELFANDSVTNTVLGPGACDTTALLDAAVTSAKIGASQLLATHYSAGSIGSAPIAASACGSTQLATGAVTTAKVSSGNITTALLDQTSSSQAVTTATMRNNCCTAAKLAALACASESYQAKSVDEGALADASVSERTLASWSSLTVNGPVVATAFHAGGSAGTSSFSLAKAVHVKVSFDNNSFPITTSYQQVPTTAARLSFSYDDDIAACFLTYQLAYVSDSTANAVTTRTVVQYYNNDGSGNLNTAYELSEEEDTLDAGSTFFPTGGLTVAVKQSDSGGDLRLGRIWIEAKKELSGSVEIPKDSDLNLVAVIVSEDSNATTIVF